jgi:hypothetical protein
MPTMEDLLSYYTFKEVISNTFSERHAATRFGVPAGPFELPPAGIVDEIKAYCNQLGVNLYSPP